jgi:hypothetical protein
MMDAIHRVQDHLRAELASKFGPGAANAIVAAFPAAVISARAALEPNGETSRIVN